MRVSEVSEGAMQGVKFFRWIYLIMLIHRMIKFDRITHAGRAVVTGVSHDPTARGRGQYSPNLGLLFFL